MEKEEYNLEDLEVTAGEIRSATMPKSITPEMVGGTFAGILSLLKGKAGSASVLSDVTVRVETTTDSVKLVITKTSAEGESDESDHKELPVASDTQAGLMTAAGHAALASLPETVISGMSVEASPESVSHESTVHTRTDGVYQGVAQTIGEIPIADKSRVGLMSQALVGKLEFLDKALSEFSGIRDERSLEIYTDWDPAVTDITEMFIRDKTTKYFPKVDTSNGTTAHAAFAESSIEHFPLLDFSSLTNADFMFRASEIREIPLFDFSHVTSAQNTFDECHNLTTIPPLDFSKVKTTGWGLFLNCTGLRTVPQLDFSSCSNLENLFNGCTSLESVEPFIPPKVSWRAVQMFSNTNLTEPPAVDFSLCNNMQSVFDGMHSCVRIGALSSGNSTSFHCTFRDCWNLESIESVDVTKTTSIQGWLVNDAKLRYLKILNFGTARTISGVYEAFKNASSWGDGSEENRQSLVDSLLTYSFDRAAAGYASFTVQLMPQVLARLTDEEKAAITAKGYTLTSY